MNLSVFLFICFTNLILNLASTASAQDCDGNGIDDAIELANAETRILPLTPPVGDGSEEVVEQLGATVDIDGDVAIVGAPNNRQQFVSGGEFIQGRAIVYRRNNGVWEQEQVLFSTEMPFTRNFGIQVAIEGNVAVVGARQGSNGGSDRIFVFRFDNQVWSLEADFNLIGLFRTGINIGRTIRISGNTIMVSGGGIQFFEYQNGLWQPTDSFLPGALPTYRDFGRSIGLDGDTAVVGAENYFEDQQGGAFVFRRLDDGWKPIQVLRHETVNRGAGFSNNDFGISVDIDGDRIVVGGESVSSELNLGVAVYQRQPDGFFQIDQIIRAPDIESSRRFGREVAISGDRISATYINAGKVVRLFERSAAGWLQVGDYSPFMGSGQISVGSGVALKGDRLIIGNVGVYNIQSIIQGDATIFDLSTIDCNADGELDRCTLSAADPDGDGQSPIDCNSNGRLDSCELGDRDCNGNGVFDECDLGLVDGNAISSDCNGDLIPDECQLAEMDCNGSGTLDECDLGFVSQLLDVPATSYDLERRTVDIEGNTLVVGLPRYGGMHEHEGRVFTYERRGTRWVLTQELRASTPVEFGEFGYDVSISGDLIAISQPRFGNEYGGGSLDIPEIYIFRRENDWWEFDAVLTSLDVVPEGDGALDLGASIDLEHGRLVSSATLSGTQSRQVAVVFERIDGLGWVVDALLNENQATTDLLPWISVNVDQVGDTVLVSAATEANPRDSMAAVFKRTESGYQQTAYFTNPDVSNYRLFGRGSLLSEDYLVVQARNQGFFADYWGGLYLYRRNGDGWSLADSILNNTSTESNSYTNTIQVGIGDLVIAERFASVLDIVGDRFRRRLNNPYSQLALLAGFSVGVIEQDGTNLVFATNYPLGNNEPHVEIGVAPLFAPEDCNFNNLLDTCDATGDVNGDLTVTMDDIPGFVDRLLTNSYCSLADINSDDAVDGRDIGPFVSALAMP